MKHKHSEVLKAWADGIECQGWDHAKKDWYDITNMSSFDFCDDARIKPTPKEDTVRYLCILTDYTSGQSGYKLYSDNLKITFDGETGELKSAEVIK